MKLEICNINYCIPLTMEQYNKLQKLSYLDDIYTPMRDFGASNVEYDGHFGQNIFFNAERKDAKNILAVVEQLLK